MTMLGGDVILHATGPAGKSLQFSTSTNLVIWNPWMLVPNPSGSVEVTDPAPSASRKIYRVQ